MGFQEIMSFHVPLSSPAYPPVTPILLFALCHRSPHFTPSTPVEFRNPYPPFLVETGCYAIHGASGTRRIQRRRRDSRDSCSVSVLPAKESTKSQNPHPKNKWCLKIDMFRLREHYVSINEKICELLIDMEDVGKYNKGQRTRLSVQKTHVSTCSVIL